MRRENITEQQSFEAARLPWSVASLRAVLTESAEAGFRLGIEKPRLAAAAAEDAIDPEQVTHDYEVLEEVIESLRYTAELRVARELEEEAAYWMEMAIEAAVILGLKAKAEERVDPPDLDTRETLTHRSVSDLLAQLVERLVASGCPVPGAQSLLDRLLREGEIARTLVVPHEGPQQEVRTGWIRDYDTGRRYQWCVLREGTQLHIGRRQAGEKSVTPELSLRAAEAEPLGRLLTQVGEDWRAA